jgi:hypothetical protein
MSNSTSDFTVTLINNVSSQVNRYLTLFTFLFGTIGNLLNIIVLSQPRLRLNPCVLYFLGSSISSLGILLIGLPSHIIAGWISSDPSNTIPWFCKMRIFLLYSFRTTSVWLLVFATIDRWFSSSAKIHRRRLSSIKVACRSIIIICISSFILWAQSIYCYDANTPDAPLKCYGKSDVCRSFNDTVYASSTVAIPSLFMLIFGLLTIHNINQSRRAIQPVVITVTNISQVTRVKRKISRRNERSLTRMLLLQVIILALCSLPQAIDQFYLTATIDVDKTQLRTAIENFIVNFNLSLTYIGNGISFYLYTLNGTVFRQALIRFIHLTITQLKLYTTFMFAQLIVFLFAIFGQRQMPMQ